MIDDFYQPAWADAHEKFTAEVSAGLAHLARWLRRRAKGKDETPPVTLGEDPLNDPAIRPGVRQGAEAEGDPPRPLQDRRRADHQRDGDREASGEGESRNSI